MSQNEASLLDKERNDAGHIDQAQTNPNRTTEQTQRKLLLAEFDLLEIDSFDFQSMRYWAAGRETSFFSTWGHVANIALNALLASSLFTLSKGWLHEIVYSGITAGLSLLAALISALMLHFKPKENLEEFKQAGAKFAALAREVRQASAQLAFDPDALTKGWEKLAELSKNYAELCQQFSHLHVGGKKTQALNKGVQEKRQKQLDLIAELKKIGVSS